MSTTRFASVAALALVVGLGVAPRSAAAAASPGMQSWVGKDSCTSTTPKGKTTYGVTAAAYGTWVKFNSAVPAAMGRPAHAGSTVVGYDAKTSLWVAMYYNTLGEYGVSKSSAAPSAKTLTFVDAYPIDPNDGPTVLSLVKTGYTMDSSMMVKGKKATFHTVRKYRSRCPS